MMSYAFEFIFVDDGSSDATVPELKKIAEQDSRVVFIELSRNFGKEAAMYAGLCNASGDYVAIMDADMQDPPSLLPEMTRLIEEEGYDSVATRRATRKGESKIRSFFARRFYSIINRISDADIVDGARDFRLMKRDMVDAVIEMSERNRFSKGIFGWVGYKTKWLEYENVERAAGETKWSFWSLVKYSIDGIVNFSNAPLAIASFLGIIFTIGIYAANDKNEYKELYNDILKTCQKYEDIKQIHGFYVDEENKCVYFDIIISFENKEPNKELSNIINELKEKYQKYDFNVILDNDFSD